MKRQDKKSYISLICLIICVLFIVSACGTTSDSEPIEEGGVEESEEIVYPEGEDEEEPGFTSLALTEDNYHYLGSTYSDICDWYHGEPDNVGFMQADNSYYTSLTPNANLEMRQAINGERFQPEDYCFGINGWFERVFEAEDKTYPMIEEVISYFDAENVTTMDVTDELEAPTNLNSTELTCMDIELDTSSGRKRVRLEIEADNEEGYIYDDSWTRIYLLDE